MLIDWFTVFAQIINFLVLVILLKRFLYRPILNAMDKREEKIGSRLQEADQKKNEAEQELGSYREKNRELDRISENMMSKAREESDAFRKEIIKKAKEEVDALKTGWHGAMLQEKSSFLKELRNRGGREVCAIARQALSDLTDSDLELLMIDVFVRRIEMLDGDELKKIKDSIKKSGEAVVVSSVFEVPENTRKSISRAVHEHINETVDIQYEISPKLLCGIELKAPGYAIGWNLEDYMDLMEEEMNKAILEEAKEKTI